MRVLIYQIDFSAIAAGKRVSSTKRKIRWRFGFANQQALDNGMTGIDCRGEEHDVSIVWSITSGKRQISMDGREVHYSTNRAGMLDFSWSSKGNHVIKVCCHAAPPMTAEPGFRQYDLSIDGQSFFTMPKVFQIGIKGSVPNKVPGVYRSHHPISPVSMGSSHLSRDAPTSREQEEQDLRRAIESSIKDARQHLGEIPNGNTERGSNRNSYSASANGGNNLKEADLLGFGGPPAYQPPADDRSVASFFSAPTTYGQDYQSPPPPTTYPAPAGGAASVTGGGALVPAVAPPGYYQASPVAQFAPPVYTSPPPPQQTYTSPPPPQQAYRSPPPVPPAPATTPNTNVAPPGYGVFNGGVANNTGGDIFGLHNNMDVNNDPFAPKAPPPPTHEDLASAILASYQTGSEIPLAPTTPGGARVTGTPHANGTMNDTTNGLSMNALAITTVETNPKNEFEKALSNLVNIDHIDEPAEGEIKLTMMKKEVTKKGPTGKSIPTPPSGLGIVGPNAPLSQIQKTQIKASEGVMNQPPPGAFNPNAANTGALVVHGQGPPPLHQMQGFGVGRTLPNGGLQNQQNLAPGQQFMQQRQDASSAQQY